MDDRAPMTRQNDPPAMRSDSTAHAVARHIETLILEGSLRPDQPLMAERSLAQTLGVSRPTLREGLRMLHEQGLLCGEKGRGMRVASLGTRAITDPLMVLLSHRPETADDYLEFRGIIEGHAAGLAAARATAIDRDAVGNALERIEAAHLAAITDAETEAAADTALHQAIYEASHNLVLLQIMRALSGNLASDVSQNRARMFSVPAIRDLLLDQHRAIARAILAGNTQAASLAAQGHLSFIRDAANNLRQSQAKLDLSRRRLTGGGLGGPL